MRWGLLALVLLMAAGTFAQEPATAPSALRQEWDHSWVRIEPWYSETERDATGHAKESPAGAYQTGVTFGPLCGIYTLASRGALTLGPSVICCPGVLYPAKTQFEVAEYALHGNEIRLAVRHRPSDSVPALPSLSETGHIQCFILARTPAELPKGRYTFALTMVEDGPAGRKPTTRPITTALQIPPPPLDTVDLKALSNEQLMREYVSRGEATTGTDAYPSDSRSLGRAAISYAHPARFRWDNVRRELRRRGSAIIPELMAMLPAEVQRNVGKNSSLVPAFGFGSDLIEAMGEIGDPRPVSLLIDVLGGKWDANYPLRRAALESLEKLTYVRFHSQGELRSGPPAGESLLLRERGPVIEMFAKDEVRRSLVSDMAQGYRKWFENEGRDPTKWLDLAKRRARETLAGDNPDEIAEAIMFLSRNKRDDAPDQTMARLGEILNQLKRVEDDKSGYFYSWNGKQLKLPVGNWLQLAAAYRGDARPLVPIITSFIDRQPPGFGYFELLATIGGEEAMAYAIGSLPRMAAIASRLPLGAAQDSSNISKQDRQLMTASPGCHWMIECGAGRTFASDEEITAWWRDNKNLRQRRWLEDSLAITAERADSGDARSQALLRRLLPDLPGAGDDLVWLPPGHYMEGFPVGKKPSPPFRADWLKANREKLKYDDVTMTFRLQ